MFFINYDMSLFFGAMDKAAGMSPLTLIRDDAEEFERKLFSNVINEQKKLDEKDDVTFENLMQIDNKLTKGASKKGQAKRMLKLVDEKRMVSLKSELSQKNTERKGMDKAVGRTGFIKFKDYESKLKMMNTPLFLFGMKLHQ
jgi:hypothetical protein